MLKMKIPGNSDQHPDGQMLYERSAPLLAELAETEKLMLDRRSSPSGLLKISTPSLFGRTVVMPVIGELTLRYPQLRIEAVMTDRLVDIVDEGFDALLRTGEPQDQRLIARALPPLRWVTVASPAYLARWGAPPGAVARSHWSIRRPGSIRPS